MLLNPVFDGHATVTGSTRAMLVALISALGLGAQHSQPCANCWADPETHWVTLTSGRQVEVISVSVDGTPQEWTFHYRTHLPMSKVGCEVAVLWRDLQTLAEREGVERALVMPENFDAKAFFAGWQSVVVSHQSTGVLFGRAEGGEWKNIGGPQCGDGR